MVHVDCLELVRGKGKELEKKIGNFFIIRTILISIIMHSKTYLENKYFPFLMLREVQT